MQADECYIDWEINTGTGIAVELKLASTLGSFAQSYWTISLWYYWTTGTGT